MFRPSSSLLFRPMPILNKLHQPLPLTPRQSTQLLNLLSTSFRQQLDLEHPMFRTDSNTDQKSTHSALRSSLSDHDKNPTDRHMHSVLTNPLFSVSPGTGKRNGTSGTLRDPMDVFSQAVANGMMTTSYARACLAAKKKRIVESSVLVIRDGMKESGAGLQVLKWLVSSGTTNSNEFLKDQEFVKIMMEYMVAEGLQESAWKWIKKSLQNFSEVFLNSSQAIARAQIEFAMPLLYLVKAEAANTDSSTSLDAAYVTLSRAAGYLGGLATRDMLTILGTPGRFLIRSSIMPSCTRPPPSEAAFESFLSLIPVITRSPTRYYAFLSLHHPTKPSPDLVLDYIRNIQLKKSSPEETRSQRTIFIESSNIQVGLDTAKLLLLQHRYTEADEVMQYLQTHYPVQLGIKERRQLEQAKAEATSLELLERLGLA
ncbi:uncharacterized protein RSE6_08983 [Rhynchosporium secalis]|uniref:Uncharacterized protein n=1 Tax=Rhynchosporium secalis TaxID=38038 RepID=A0A1E1MGU4_RHYSE|nr:uncharacterized protein RSE6_08983 [Rhynchosporium secalis]